MKTKLFLFLLLVTATQMKGQTEITHLLTDNSCNASITSSETTICSGSSSVNLSVNLSGASGTNSNCFSPKVVGLSNTNFGLNATCKDNNGNLFVAGAYTGNTNFGNLTLAGIGGKDVFLVKYNSCGVQQWALRGGSTGNEDYAGVGTKSIATDASGNIFIVGRYNQTFTFYGNNNTSFVAPYTSTSNGNHQDGYLIKLNANGEVLWGATLRGGSNDGFNGVAVDNSGNPIVTGGFNGCCPSTFAVTIYGPNGSLGVSSFGSNYGSGLVVKFDANGNILWKAAVYNRDTGLSRLAIDGTNNIYLVSEFRSWSNGTAAQFIDANGTNNSLYNPGIGLGFLVKLNSSGIWQWGTSYGNVGDGVGSLTNGTDVAIDENGNPWISGFYRGATATFYSTSGSTLSLPASTNDIGFIAKYSSTGVPQFVNSLQQSTGSTYFSSIAISNGTVGIGGYFTGNNLGSNDMLFAKYDTNAVFQSVNTGGGSGDDQANSVISNSTGFVVSGTVGSTSSIDGVSLNTAGTFLWNNYISGVSSNSFLWSTGETTATINPSPTETTTYWCDVTTNGATCRKEITITVIANPPPEAVAQIFCSSATVANLVATGTDLKWYTAETSGTALATDVVLVSGTYYVSQTINGCESTRTAVAVSVNDAQITASANTICSGTAVTISASESSAESATLPANLQNGLVGYWPFNGNASDASGNNNNGTVNGATLTTDRFGISNGAYSFDGINDNINFHGINVNLNDNEINTVSFWTKWNGIGSIPFCWIPDYSFYFHYNQIGINTYEGNTIGINSNPFINQWKFVVIQFYNGVPNVNNSKIWVDGVIQTINGDATQFRKASKDFVIGSGYDNGYYFSDKLDDLAIYNRALSPQEIAQLYTPAPTYLWSTGETTATINPIPTETTTYWCDVTVNGLTCRKEKTITVNPNVIYYADNDGDGFGNPAVSQQSCTGTPTGYVTNNTDCNDNNKAATTAIVISNQPTNASICKAIGGAASFTVATTAETATYQWYSQAATATTWTAITNNTNYSGATTATLNSTKTTTTVPATGTKYKVVATNSCGMLTSTIVTLTDLTVLSKAATISVVGTLSPLLTTCQGNSVNLLLAAGSVGNIQWQSSTDGIIYSNVGALIAQSALSATNAAMPFNTGVLNQTTWFRVVASNGVCSSVNGTATKITVSPSVNAGIISGGDVTVCAPLTTGIDANGNALTTAITNSTLLSISDYTVGATILWQKSVNYTAAAPTWATVANLTATTAIGASYSGAGTTALTVGNLAADTWYRVLITNGACSVATAVTKIAVNKAAKAGTTTSATNGVVTTSVCNGGAITFTSTAYTGTAIQWEVSTTSTTTGFVAIEGATGISFTMNNVSYAALSKFYVRSVVTSGSCTLARSVVKTITVTPSIISEFVQVPPICAGSSLNALPTTSTNGITGTWSPAINNLATTTYTFTPTAGLCSITAAMTITVTPKAIPTFSPMAAVCSGSVTDALPTTSLNGYTGTWSPALNNFETTKYTFTPAEGQCVATVTQTIEIITIPSPIAANQTFCGASTVANLVATGENVKWYASANDIVALASSTALATGTYYATQTINGCESTRSEVAVSVNDAQITASATTVCIGNAVELTASANAAGSTTLPANLQNGLVGYWPFNGNANDASGNNNNGLVNGHVQLTTDRFGISNSSYLFPGNSNSYISVPGSQQLQIQSEITISAWVLMDGGEYNSRIIQYSDNSNSGYCIYAHGNSNISRPLTGLITNVGGLGVGMSSELNSLVWNHVCFVADSNGSGRLYINGLLVSTDNGTVLNNVNYMGDLNIGRIWHSSDAGWGGKLDDIAIYNRALTASETSQLYNQGQTSYIWSTGETTATINPTPTETTTYWCDVTTDGTTCRKEITIEVTPKEVPTFSPVASICAGSSVEALPTTSLNGYTGTWSPALNNLETTEYTFTPADGQCAATVTQTIEVITIPAPIAAAQTFCSPSTVANLVATGENIKWYASANEIATLASSTALTSGVYYASQTINACESLRNEVVVTINDAEIMASATTVCIGTTVNLAISSNLISNTEGTSYVEILEGYSGVLQAPAGAVFKNVNFASYGVPTGGSGNYQYQWCNASNSIAVVSNLCIGNNSCVLNSNNGVFGDPCFGTYKRLFVSATYSKNNTSYNWSTGETTAAINPTPTETTTYWCDVTTDGTTCRNEITIEVTPKAVPTFSASAKVCSGSVLDALPATSINGYTGTWSPALNNLATTEYTFTPHSGRCVATATQTIEVITIPSPIATAQTFCGASAVANLVATGENIKWYASANEATAFESSTALATGTYYATQTVNGCESTRTAVAVSINDAEITATASTVCSGAQIQLEASNNLRINVPIQDPIISGLTQSDFTLGARNIGFYSWTYGLPGMLVYGDDNQKYSSLETTLFVGNGGFSAGIAIGVKPNKYNDNFKYNGPGCYNLSISHGRLSLLDGTGNTPSGYWPHELMAVDVPEINFSLPLSYKLKIELKPNSHIYCYLNDILKIDYIINSGSIYNGKLALVTANSSFQFSKISSSYISNTYLWSTGETTSTINPTPTETTAYWCDVTTDGATCRKEITIEVTPKTVPTFGASAVVCSGSVIDALPTTSTNGITGTWSPALNNTTTTTYTFTPTAGQCANTTTQTISVTTPKVTSAISFETPVQQLSVGMSYAGGKIIYIFQPGDAGYVSGQTHGLIIATGSITTTASGINFGPYFSTFGCSGVSIANTSAAMGTGISNTNILAATCGSSTVASFCDLLVENGYSDWFLPSKDELSKVYQNYSLVGGVYPIQSQGVWSSSEVNASSSYVCSFDGGGGWVVLPKTYGFAIKPLRKF